jgi:bacillithiol system protein YtxJ
MATIRTLTTPAEVEDLLEKSRQSPVWIFKHSLTCGTSASAWSQYQSFVAGRPDDDTVYALIEVQRARPASDTLAEKTGVRHESPQVFLLRDGQAAWHASHWKIKKETLEEV